MRRRGSRPWSLFRLPARGRPVRPSGRARLPSLCGPAGGPATWSERGTESICRRALLFQAHRGILAAWRAAPAPQSPRAGRTKESQGRTYGKRAWRLPPVVAGKDKPGFEGVSIAARLRLTALPASRGVGYELYPDPERARRARCEEGFVDLGARRRQVAAREKILPQRAGGGVASVEDVGELCERPQAAIELVVEIQIEDRVSADLTRSQEIHRVGLMPVVVVAAHELPGHRDRTGADRDLLRQIVVRGGIQMVPRNSGYAVAGRNLDVAVRVGGAVRLGKQHRGRLVGRVDQAVVERPGEFSLQAFESRLQTLPARLSEVREEAGAHGGTHEQDVVVVHGSKQGRIPPQSRGRPRARPDLDRARHDLFERRIRCHGVRKVAGTVTVRTAQF